MVWVLVCTVNVGFAVFAVFLVPMRAELGVTTGQLSGALSLSIAVNGAAAVYVGRYLDRHGARWLTSGGSLLGALSVVGWSQAQDLVQLHAAFVGVGLAGVLAACAVPQALVLHRAPEDLGLGVDGDPTGPHSPPVLHSQTSAEAVAAAWRLRSVRLLTWAAVLEMVAITANAVHLVAYLRDTGEDATTATWVAGAIGIYSVVGRVVVTSLAVRTGLARLSAVLVAAQAIGIAGLALPRPFSLGCSWCCSGPGSGS